MFSPIGAVSYTAEGIGTAQALRKNHQGFFLRSESDGFHSHPRHQYKGNNMKKKVVGLVGALEIELKGTDDILVMELAGQIDSYTAEEIKKIIDTHMLNGKSKIIVDLSSIDYLDSAGLSSLINAKTKLAKISGDLRLVGLKGKAKEVFDLAGFTVLFNNFETCEKALEGF